MSLYLSVVQICALGAEAIVMKMFVTGATGLLGSNLVRALRAEGHSVRALVRSKEKAQRQLGDTGAELVVGGMENVPGFVGALDGVEVSQHAWRLLADESWASPGSWSPTAMRAIVLASAGLTKKAKNTSPRRRKSSSARTDGATRGARLVH
jgi:nucleoside-diphosphate-sugar epimerase